MTIITPPETIITPTRKLFCDGSTIDAGHPRVFLTVNSEGYVDCPYCSRHFVLDDAHAHADAH